MRDYLGGANVLETADNLSSIAGVGRYILFANIFFHFAEAEISIWLA